MPERRHAQPFFVFLPAGLLLALAGGALGQSGPLAGPEVTEASGPSLVDDGLLGMTSKPDDRPEIAAIELLGLDGATRARVDAILAEHASAMDEVLRDNLLELQGWTNRLRSGSPEERRAAAVAVREAYQPVRALGPIEDKVREALTDADAERYTALIAEYEARLETEARAQAEANGESFRPMRHRIRREFEKIGQDVKAAYDRWSEDLAGGSRSFDRKLTESGISPEGETAVRTRLRAMYEASGFQPTPADHRRAIMEVMGELDAGDRRSLVRALRPSEED